MTTMSAGAANQIYLIGEPQGWNINDDSMVLPETSTPGIYAATFNIPSGKFMFRFYTSIGNWDAGSLGAQAEDNPVVIDLTDGIFYTAHYVDKGKGSWSYPDWEGGDLYITVNINNQSVVFTTDPDAQIPELMPDIYFMGSNINGVSAWNGEVVMTYDYSRNIYTWQGTSLGSGFKFTDNPSWKGEYNIGSNGSPLVPGTAYSYFNGATSGNITFSSDNEVINNPVVELDLKAGTVLVKGTSEMQETRLTLAGTFNDWVSNDDNYLLTENADGTYSGQFDMLGGVEFQVVLLGSTWYGCTEGQGDVTLGDEATVKTLAKGYENNFVLVDWTGGEIKFTVDLDAMTLKMEKATAGIFSIENDLNGEESIYNLQGVKISRANLTPGIYVINGKKTIVR